MLYTVVTTLSPNDVCSYLGEALRAVLVAELRTCRVSGVTACDRLPANLPEGRVAVRCYVRTASGATTTVVLGGPAEGDPFIGLIPSRVQVRD